MSYPSLDQLHRKCRHPPKMGGNTETITMPCALVARLIGILRRNRLLDRRGRVLVARAGRVRAVEEACSRLK